MRTLFDGKTVFDDKKVQPAINMTMTIKDQKN